MNKNVEKKSVLAKCVWVVARLPQRLKSMVFEIFSSLGYSSETLYSNVFQKTLILAFEANSALSCQNELFPTPI